MLAEIQRGSKLKKVAERVIKEVRKTKPKQGAEPVDLITALKERMSLRRKGISGSRKGVEEEEARGGATAEVPPVRLPAGAERGDGESAASTPRSRRSSREQAGTSSSAEDEGPISMRGMRLSLQASQANLLARGADKAEDDEEWDDD